MLLQPTFRRALTDPLEELERIDHRHRLPIASGLALVLIAEVRPHQRAAAEQSRLWRRRATLGFAVYYQHPARHPDQADGRLEPHHPHDRATDRRRAYRSRQSGRHGRHPAELLLLAGQARERDHPGRGTRVPLPDGDARRDQRQPVRRRTDIRRADAVPGLHVQLRNYGDGCIFIIFIQIPYVTSSLESSSPR